MLAAYWRLLFTSSCSSILLDGVLESVLYKMKPAFFKYALGQLLHGLVICRKPDSWMARLAFLLLCGLLAGWIMLGMQSAIAWVFATLVLGVLILLAQSRLQQIRRDFREDIEHQVFIIGVGDTRGLLTAIPAHIRGQRVSYELPQPVLALRLLLGVEQRVTEAQHGQPATAIKVVYAGQAPSPIAFLMGFYLGYSRIDAIMESAPMQPQAWQLLDALDDGVRFETRGLEQLKTGMPEVTLIMRAHESATNEQTLAQSAWLAPQHPVITMTLTGPAQACLSASKQICLANQFGAVLQALADHGVAAVHVHYAGPHSLLFNLGRQYRRLPQLTLLVYQSERCAEDSWGLRMPANANTLAELISAETNTREQAWPSSPPQVRYQAPSPTADSLACRPS